MKFLTFSNCSWWQQLHYVVQNPPCKWQSIVLCERMLRRQIKQRIWGPPFWLIVLFVLLICIVKSTQVFNLLMVISKTLATSKFNQCSFACSANLLLSVSLSDTLFPISFYLYIFHINILMIWRDCSIAINWLHVNVCFIWGSLTILNQTLCFRAKFA